MDNNPQAVSAVGLALALTGGAVALAASSRASVAAKAPAPLRPPLVCPGHNRHTLVSTAMGSRSALVPAGERRVLLCRYRGVDRKPAKALRLVALRIVRDGRSVKRLASEFNRLEPDAGVRACPAASGASIVAFFRYAPVVNSDDPVTVGLTGCRDVTNGHLARSALRAPGPRLLEQLDALTSGHGTRSRPYSLIMHCGIAWAWIDGTFWKAATPLSDGNGNPPPGWGNPTQEGTLTFTSSSTAVFRSIAGSVTFQRTGLTAPPFLCA